MSTDELLTAMVEGFGFTRARQASTIARRLGVASRHLGRPFVAGREAARPGQSNPALAAAAVEAALAEAGMLPRDLGYLIAHTATPAQALPANVASVADLLGFDGPIVELRQASTGFGNALMIASGLIAADGRPVALVGSERVRSISIREPSTTTPGGSSRARRGARHRDPRGHCRGAGAMSAVRRVLAVARVETLQLLRSRMTFTLLLLVPALQLLLFGFAIRPTGVDVTVALAAPTAQIAARVADALRSESGLTLVAMKLAPGGAAALVRRGDATIGIEVPSPPGFAGLRDPEPVRVVVDASNAVLVAAAVPAIEAAYWRAAAGKNAGPWLLIERLHNPASRADWTFLPALIGITVMISAILLGTLSVARERGGGTSEALLALPLQTGEALAGRLLPHVVLGTLQGSAVLVAAVTIFDLPARGNVAALLALLPLLAASHLVIGQAIAARAATQLAALQGAVAFYLPAAARGGVALVAAQALPMLAVLAAAALVALLARSRRHD